ncbi:MAG: hypothetical protein K6F33_00960 [Bacteroidales bacterium]|nr:hypothetical protein [Bacteroidales bacterium]
MKHFIRTLCWGIIFYVMSAGIASAQNSHDYVDLMLPSGTLWANCNIGADNPWERGDYYAWGETSTKAKYDWQFYQYADGNYDKLIKYCNKASYGNDGYTDRLKMLESADDAADANWGLEWCMPTAAQYQELLEYCDYEWTVNYGGKGVAGWVFKSKKNSNEIFFPAAGYDGRDGNPTNVGAYGFYWTSSLDISNPGNASILYFHSGYVGASSNSFRYYGHSVRAVRK